MSALKIAVVGAGIFGITAAVKLAGRGHIVDLFEKNEDILTAASGSNQFRLHRGYHYPRSVETARSGRDSEASFREEYTAAILNDFQHYYCISKRGSMTSPDQFLAFCNAMNLEYTPAWIEVVQRDAVELCVLVKESLLDLKRLRLICYEKLNVSGVNLRLGSEVDEKTLSRYDFAVIATYSSINSFLDGFGQARRDYQFELCEKPVVRLPKQFEGKSIVILDGPFMCVDPLGRSGLFILGNVVHAIHQTNVGKAPIIDERYKPLMNKGIIKNPPVTNFSRFVSSAAEFYRGIEKAEHVGSMFTIRTVLPYRDDTDERPTIVEKVGDRIITIFSGKIGTCAEVANQLVDIIESGTDKRMDTLNCK